MKKVDPNGWKYPPVFGWNKPIARYPDTNLAIRFFALLCKIIFGFFNQDLTSAVR